MDGSLYTGITTDVERRLEEHTKGIGSRYTRARRVEKVIYVEECENRSIASERESQIKHLSREDKLALTQTQKVS